MTHKEQMLAAITGEPLDRLPWVPRLDLWYRANCRAGTLPAPYQQATLLEIVDALDMGMHMVIPDFRDLRGPEDDIDRALGMFNLHGMPYATVLNGVERRVTVEGDYTTVEYVTPKGRLRTRVLFDEAMRNAGITLTHVAEPVVKGVEDFAALGYLFEHARVMPNYDGYARQADEIGDRGLAVAFVNLAASPMQMLMRDMISFEEFCFLMVDYPEELAHLAAQIDVYWRRVLDVAVECPAEIFLVGGNYDAAITCPPFFARHILPWLQEYAATLHQRGKYLLSHTDGENTGLLDYYREAGIDIADSICPAPMTNLTFGAVRESFAGNITIMGGIPSIAFLPDSMSDDAFQAYLDEFFQQIGAGDHLILGISDTTPPAADFARILYTAQRIRDFGAIQAE